MKATLPNRRRFVFAGARCLALGGMSVLAVAQLLKARRLADDPNCVRIHTCAACLSYGDCTKPKALAFRRGGSGGP